MLTFGHPAGGFTLGLLTNVSEPQWIKTRFGTQQIHKTSEYKPVTLLGRWPASLLQHNLSMLLLANLNFSPCYFSFELLQIVMRKGRVHPRISYEMAPPALSQPPTSGTLYLAKKGCLPPVISISSSRSSMQRTGRPVLREASEGQKPGGLHTSPAL